MEMFRDQCLATDSLVLPGDSTTQPHAAANGDDANEIATRKKTAYRGLAQGTFSAHLVGGHPSSLKIIAYLSVKVKFFAKIYISCQQKACKYLVFLTLNYAIILGNAA
jgi:hypothetical protein